MNMYCIALYLRCIELFRGWLKRTFWLLCRLVCFFFASKTLNELQVVENENKLWQGSAEKSKIHRAECGKQLPCIWIGISFFFESRALSNKLNRYFCAYENEHEKNCTRPHFAKNIYPLFMHCRCTVVAVLCIMWFLQFACSRCRCCCFFCLFHFSCSYRFRWSAVGMRSNMQLFASYQTKNRFPLCIWHCEHTQTHRWLQHYVWLQLTTHRRSQWTPKPIRKLIFYTFSISERIRLLLAWLFFTDIPVPFCIVSYGSAGTFV